MVKIENVEEFRKITESDYGFVIIIDENPTIHLSNCKIVSEINFQQKNTNSVFHWFSTYSLAQKELGDLNSCSICSPESD